MKLDFVVIYGYENIVSFLVWSSFNSIILGRCLDFFKVVMETIGGTSSGVITVNYEVSWP